MNGPTNSALLTSEFATTATGPSLDEAEVDDAAENEEDNAAFSRNRQSNRRLKEKSRNSSHSVNLYDTDYDTCFSPDETEQKKKYVFISILVPHS